jgi:exodeoxyribonuclease III
MRIASYNLFEGAQDDLSLLQDFVRQQDIDVLCVQEANGWNDGEPTQLERLAAETGLDSYVYGDSNTRYKLATLSRLPILRSQVYTDGFWHSAIQTTIRHDDETLDFWNIHLNPGDEDSRLAEAAKIVGMIDMAKSAIVMGDFNSLSEADRYPDELISQLTQQGIKKFGTDRLRFDVVDYFTRGGLVDLANELGNRETTVPTPANTDMHHAAKMRLDYMFATRALIGSVSNMAVPKNALTDTISDHYPVVLTLE